MALTELLWGWNVRVNGILSFFSLCDVRSADCQFVERSDEPLEYQKKDSHVFRKTGTFLVFC